ncbi:MAG: DUF4203 domain-containing protein [Verrucomicrobiota bacterium]
MKLPLPILSVLIGLAVLLFGRKLFWLFVAAVGFAIGIEITPHLMQHPPAWLAIAVALILGLMGALLAIVLQKFAIAVVGFLAGARLAIMIAGAFFVEYAHYYGITFLIGGILGAILLLVLFDWALIILSSVEGAHLIQNAIQLPPTGAGIFFVALVVLGIIVQAAMMGRGRT